jgi:hypothetical protein
MLQNRNISARWSADPLTEIHNSNRCFPALVAVNSFTRRCD